MKKRVLLSVFSCILSIFMYAQPGELAIKKSEQGLYLDHTVAPKEGLYAIGRLYNVNPKFIAVFNKIDLNAGINIGQIIQIPLTDTNFTQKAFTGTPVYYIVEENAGLLKVSNENNKVSLQKLRDWNGLKNDNLSVGSRLVVGFLISKEMSALAANNAVKNQPVKADVKNDAKDIPAKQEADLKQSKPEEVQLVKNETRKETIQPVKDEPKKTEPAAAVIKEPALSPANSVQGYFKSNFQQQVRSTPASKNETVTSGIFKTNSGWQDAKYYLLIDNVATGTIVKISNPGNNKVIYAKVLGQMNGIRQNAGLDIRISNAAAASLGVTDMDKFIVKVNY